MEMISGVSLIVMVVVCVILAVTSFEFKPLSRSWVGCLSHYEASVLKNHFKSYQNSFPVMVNASVDLGFSSRLVLLSVDGVRLSSEESAPLVVSWKEIESILNKSPARCYSLYDDGSEPKKVATISVKTNIPASLCPPLKRSGAPTMVLGGFTMHRISGDNVDPMIDTLSKVSCIDIRPGYHVLDTCLGLGYTAIKAAERVIPDGRVTSVEYDDASYSMCAYNPWSQRLFNSELPIEILEGDVCELVSEMPDQSVDAIIHDPPALALCRTNVYGQDTYNQFRRVLRRGRHLFHYIGNPTSKESGRLFKGIIDRLTKAGFRRVEQVSSAFGVRAW